MLISLEGIDGAGKTTICQEVTKYQDLSIKLESVSRKVYEGNSNFVSSIAEKLSYILWHSGDSKDLPKEFWLHTQVAWHIMLSEQIKFYKNHETVFLMDGWYYKFLSRLVVVGWDLEQAIQMFESVVEPDFVILLKVNPEAVLERRQFRPTEQGLHDSRYKELSRNTFIEYQNNTFDILHKLEKQRDNWNLVDLTNLDVFESAEVVKAEIISIFENKCI